MHEIEMFNNWMLANLSFSKYQVLNSPNHYLVPEEHIDAMIKDFLWNVTCAVYTLEQPSIGNEINKVTFVEFLHDEDANVELRCLANRKRSLAIYFDSEKSIELLQKEAKTKFESIYAEIFAHRVIQMQELPESISLASKLQASSDQKETISRLSIFKKDESASFAPLNWEASALRRL